MSKKSATKTIFLSHSSADEKLVEALSDLLTTGCGIRGTQIIITTLPGQGIPAGNSNYIAWLKEKMANSSLVILLLTPNYFESKFCLCEMGAAWGLDLPWFPLVVPPLKNSEVKEVMAVTQNLSIGSEACLDELRDKVLKELGAEQPTSAWTVKRDTFLGKLPRIIKKLPQPDKVDRSVLQASEAKYAASQKDIAEKEETIDALKEEVADLEKCKDKTQVKAVRAKHSSLEEQFEKLCEAAGLALGKIELATSDLLFKERGGQGEPTMDADWYESANKAASNQEIDVDERYSVRTDHPRVHKAETALDELQSFINHLPDGRFQSSFEDEHEFPLSLHNKEFWDFLR